MALLTLLKCNIMDQPSAFISNVFGNVSHGCAFLLSILVLTYPRGNYLTN